MQLNRALAMPWSLCLLWASCVLAAPLSNTDTNPKPKPKVLLISFDGFRWDYDRDVDTPNLDQMALDGVKAQYVTPPYISITSPAHFTLLTGKHGRFPGSPARRGTCVTREQIGERHPFGSGRGRNESHGKKKELVVIECPRAQQLL